MHLTNHAAFHQFLKSKKTLSSCLLVGKDRDEAMKSFFSHFDLKPVFYEPGPFPAFLQELETKPLFASQNLIHLDRVDHLPLDWIHPLARYLHRPNPWTILLLTGESFPKKEIMEAIKESGVVFHNEEKPWEKKKRLANRLIALAAGQNAKLAPAAAQALVEAFSDDPILMENELNKLICYVGEGNSITPQDLHLLTPLYTRDTLWRLGDALLLKRFSSAHQIGSHLLDRGVSFFSILAHLRTQLANNIVMMELYAEGGREKTAAAFPYLKGARFENKLQSLQQFGLDALKQGQVDLFDTEVTAKNSSVPPLHLLELFFFKICYSSSLTS